MPCGFASAMARPPWSCMAYPRCERMGCWPRCPISAWETRGGVCFSTLAIAPRVPHFCLGSIAGPDLGRGSIGGPDLGWNKDHEMDAVPISAMRGVCQAPARAYTDVNRLLIAPAVCDPLSP